MVNTVGQDISEVIKSYTAGFLDADGAIMATIERHKEKKYGFRVRVIVKITQRDKVNVEWFLEQFGFGLIVQNRSVYDWLIRDQKNVLSFLNLVSPYILTKKNQAEIAKNILGVEIKSKDDLVKIASMADTLSSYNVRSKIRRRNYSSMIQEVLPPVTTD
jgi:hypothetical protein